MILHKGFGGAAAQQQSTLGVPSNTATILGLKVVGGKLLQGGTRIGAVIEKVKKGSVADTVGRLIPGKGSCCCETFDSLYLRINSFLCIHFL